MHLLVYASVLITLITSKFRHLYPHIICKLNSMNTANSSAPLALIFSPSHPSRINPPRSMCCPTRNDAQPLLKIPAGTPPNAIPPVSLPIAQNPPTSDVGVRRSRQRRDFLLFVRVLIKCIEQSHNYKLTLQTKALVAECVKRNRMGDPHFSPLQDSMEIRLRGLVGQDYWHQAKDYIHCFQKAKCRSSLKPAERPSLAR